MNEKFGNGYALLIGVGQSAYPKWSLPVTVKDMQALRAILTDPALCGYPDNDAHIRLLHDAGASQQAILQGLAWLATQVAADSDATAVVFYSGHGWLDNSTGRYYLLPHDVEPFDLAASALPATAFTDALCKVQARRLLVFVDSCHAAGMATAKDADALKLPAGFSQAALPKGLVEELKQGAGRAVFTSSLGKQRSWVRPDGTLSLYTFHLIEALQGAGNQPGDTTVRVSNLMAHLGKAVPASAQAMGKEQVPFFDTATEDFAVALLLGGKGLGSGSFSSAQAGAASPPAVQASGNGSVAAGAISENTVFSGDHNQVQQGKYNIRIGNVQGLVIGDQAQLTQVFATSPPPS
ncbi:MAG: caspase family protein [Anaerolineae bacterium]